MKKIIFYILLLMAGGNMHLFSQPQLMLQTPHALGVDYGFFSHDGRLIYTVSRTEGLCKVWEAYSGKLLKDIRINTKEHDFYLMPTDANDGMFLLSDLTKLSFLNPKGDVISTTDWVGKEAPVSYHDEGSGTLVFDDNQKKYYDIWDILTGQRLIHREYKTDKITYQWGAMIEVIDDHALRYYDLSAHALSDTIRLKDSYLGPFNSPVVNAWHHHVFYKHADKIYCHDTKTGLETIVYTGMWSMGKFIISEDEKFLLIQGTSSISRYSLSGDGDTVHVKENLGDAVITRFYDQYMDPGGDYLRFPDIGRNILYDMRKNKALYFRTAYDDIGHWGRSKDFDMNGNNHILAYTLFITQPGSLYSTAPNAIKVIHTESGDTAIILMGGENIVSSVSISPDGKTILVTGKNKPTNKGIVYLYDITGRFIWAAPSGAGPSEVYNDIERIDMLTDSTMFTVMANSGSKVWNLRQGNVSKYDTKYSTTAESRDLPVYDHQKQLIVWQEDKNDHVEVTIKNAQSRSVVQSFRLQGSYLYMYRAMLQAGQVSIATFSPDDMYLAFLGTSQLVVYKKSSPGHYSFLYIDSSLFTGINTVSFTPGSRQMYYATSDGKIKIYDLSSGSLSLANISLPGQVNDIYFTPSGRSMVIYCTGDLLVYYDLITKKTVASLIEADATAVEAVLPSGYYSLSSKSSAKIGFVDWPHYYPFDQLDIKYNRPDKVLQAMGCRDTELISSYYHAWQKRIEKLEIDTSSFKEGFSVPEGDFCNRTELADKQAGDEIKLKIWGADSSYILDRYNVWVNDVPIYGMRGINVRKDSTHHIEKEVSLTLSEGENKIETSVINANGIESYRIPLYLSYTPKEAHIEKLYFAGIGIDRFKDNTHPLRYCVKDIHDLADSLSKRYGKNIEIDTLFNEQVFIENVKKIKNHLRQSSVDDKVIIAYSGHGLLSANYDYYLSAYGINFAKPEQGGIPYDELESLLDSIPSRKKLMLIDACNSGEVDKDEVASLNKTIDSSKKGIHMVYYPNEKRLGLKNSFELMLDLFANVGRGTGATVLSAAAGTQEAIEDEKHSNGFFTYSILELMGKRQTAKVSELSNYVSRRVEELSNGLQKPTSRRENQDNDWQVW